MPAALECVRRHVAQGSLPGEPPYTEPDLFDFLQPHSVPDASLRYVLAQDVSTCCVRMRTTERLEESLTVLDPPYLDPQRLATIKKLFAGIQCQVR